MAESDLHFGASMGLGIQETAAEARWLEELGYEYVAAGEHFMRGNPPGPTSAALPILAVAAGATTRIGLLSSVILLPFYHPTVLAKLTSTLDIASGGRLTLGVGVGGEFPVEFHAAGISPTQRGRRSNECLGGAEAAVDPGACGLPGALLPAQGRDHLPTAHAGAPSRHLGRGTPGGGHGPSGAPRPGVGSPPLQSSAVPR